MIKKNGDRIVCPYVDANVSDSGKWLSNQIPSPNFDIAQAGNVRKAEEAEALFSCVIVSKILRHKLFEDELEGGVIVGYDFKNMSPQKGHASFIELLQSWQEIQSIVLNVIISACRYKISSQKKDIEIFLRDGLEKKEKDGLRDLREDLKGINTK